MLQAASDPSKLAWVYAGSHNLSAAAWGVQVDCCRLLTEETMTSAVLNLCLAEVEEELRISGQSAVCFGPKVVSPLGSRH